MLPDEGPADEWTKLPMLASAGQPSAARRGNFRRDCCVKYEGPHAAVPRVRSFLRHPGRANRVRWAFPQNPLGISPHERDRAPHGCSSRAESAARTSGGAGIQRAAAPRHAGDGTAGHDRPHGPRALLQRRRRTAVRLRIRGRAAQPAQRGPALRAGIAGRAPRAQECAVTRRPAAGILRDAGRLQGRHAPLAADGRAARAVGWRARRALHLHGHQRAQTG